MGTLGEPHSLPVLTAQLFPSELRAVADVMKQSLKQGVSPNRTAPMKSGGAAQRCAHCEDKCSETMSSRFRKNTAPGQPPVPHPGKGAAAQQTGLEQGQ